VRRATLAGVVLALALTGTAAAAPFKLKVRPPDPARVTELVTAIDTAMGEKRFVDAGLILDRAAAMELNDPRLTLRTGLLQLERDRFELALRSFTEVEADPTVKPQALQGKGMALSSMGRSQAAIEALTAAITADPSLWRAWNALAVERDKQKDWAGAEQAYAEALKLPEAGAFVLSNRGYSRLLQGRREEASSDFVAALAKDPALSVARSNLRLALAMRGDYRRATAVSGNEDRAAVLNNAGFAAMMRGELDEAEHLLQQAIDARGSTYGRAFENLELVKSLKQQKAESPATP